jgi:hypothetical protein
MRTAVPDARQAADRLVHFLTDKMPNILALQPEEHPGSLTGHQHHKSWQNEKRKLGPLFHPQLFRRIIGNQPMQTVPKRKESE